MENQDREVALKSPPLLYQWRVRERIGYIPSMFTSNERCIKSPA